MDINLFYMILGIVITVIVGYWGINITNKYRTKTNLLYFEIRCISLFGKALKDLDEIEILYKGKEVDQNLIIYKGTFFNSGNSDIINTLIYKPLKLKLPKDYEWREVLIIDKSEDVNIEIQYNTNEITFIWDILKENEFFTFDSVIEYKPQLSKKYISNDLNEDVSANLSKNVKINCRIYNLKSIEKENIPQKLPLIGDSLYVHWIIFVIIFGGILMYLISARIININYNILHEIVIDSKCNYYTIESKHINEVQLTDSLGNIF